MRDSTLNSIPLWPALAILIGDSREDIKFSNGDDRNTWQWPTRMTMPARECDYLLVLAANPQARVGEFLLLDALRASLIAIALAKARSLDILVQPRRDRKAALKLMRKLLKKQGVTPATIVTDKLD